MSRNDARGHQTPRADYTIDQDWEAYTDAEHGVWRDLFRRQAEGLRGRAAPEFEDGVRRFGMAAEGIPDFRRLNDTLAGATGWRIVAVPGLVPDDIFFDHLAHRRFPSTCFIRRRDQMDYIQEPDIFHDVFGHVPLLINPVFADFMQLYGRKGQEALALGRLHNLARLYWYTAEFGLIRTRQGLRIYGSGIVSSKGEVAYCLDSPRPNRIAFAPRRVMRTRYRIDDFQECYFVIDRYEDLFEAVARDLPPEYEAIAGLPDIAPGDVVPGDTLLTPASAPS